MIMRAVVIAVVALALTAVLTVVSVLLARMETRDTNAQFRAEVEETVAEMLIEVWGQVGHENGLFQVEVEENVAEMIEDARMARLEAMQQETDDLLALLQREKERSLAEWNVIFEENRAHDRRGAEATIDRIAKQLADAREEIRGVVAEENAYAIAEMRALSDEVVEIANKLLAGGTR